jgi:hypothetical protein
MGFLLISLTYAALLCLETADNFLIGAFLFIFMYKTNYLVNKCLI